MAEVRDNIVNLEVVYNKFNNTIDRNIQLLKEASIAVDAYNKKISVVPSEFQKSLTDIKTKTDAVTNSTKELTAVEKERIRIEKQLEVTSAKIKVANEQNTTTLNTQKSVLRALNGAYAELNEKHKRASQTLQDLIVRGRTAEQTQRQYNRELRNAQREFQSLDARIRHADQAVGRFNRNVGNYPRQAVAGIRNLIGAFGVAGGIYLFASVIKDAFNTIKEFDKANADLAATMGKSRKEITALTEDAKRLGAITKFTSTEVSALQKEFAKFGFNENEILNATQATLNLAAATGEDLAKSAMVAAQTLRGFGLDATEMGRVTDVMASSFTKSALDLSNFTESMKYVAPIAKTAGVDIEFATGMLAKLADAGIKGSMAGTSLRRILTEMAKTGKPVKEAFEQIVKSGISVTDAMDEVGRTAQTSLIVLSENKDAVFELAEAFDKAGGSAEKMAKEQLNSLSGQITLMTSAWDGLIQSFNSGDGVISNLFRGLIGYATMVINLFTELNNLAFGDDTEKKKKESQKKSEQGYNDEIKLIQALSKQNKFNADERKKEIEGQIALNKKEIASEQEKIKLYKNNIAQSRSSKVINENKELIKTSENYIKVQQSYLESNKGRLKGLQSVLDAEKKTTKETNENTKATEGNTKAKKENNKEKVKEIKSIQDVVKFKEEEQKAQLGSRKWLEDNISSQKKQIDLLAKGSEEYERAVAGLEYYEYWLEMVYGAGEKNAKSLEDQKEKLKELFNSEEFFGGFVSSFSSGSGFSEIFNVIDLLDKKFEDSKEKNLAVALAISEAFQQAFNTISEASQNNFNAEYERLETQKDFAIEMAGGSATAREEIERQYEERKKAIQRREAESQKRLAIFNIAIDTAQAIVASVKASPKTFGLPFSAIAAAIGAAQIAMVASQQIPQFWKGTENAPEGLAWTQEKGAEVITDRNGKVKTLGSNKGAQLTYLSKGDKVYKSHEDYINKVLSKNGIDELGSYMNFAPKTEIVNSFDMAEMRNEFSKLANVIKSKDGVSISIDEQGFRKRQGNTEFINSRLNLKSRLV